MTGAKTKQYDVCIIGAGPAGLACLSAIQEPYSLDTLNESQVQRAVRQLPNGRRSIAVIDPNTKWMAGWERKFEALDIKFLRSPTLAHPDVFDQNALLAFAQVHCRQNELFESGCGDLQSLLPLGQSQVGLWKLPSASLFADFCQQLSNRLDHECICGKVVDIRHDDNHKSKSSSSPTFELDLESGEKIHSRAVILAMGAVGSPNIPQSLANAPCLMPWTDLKSIDYNKSSWSKVLVVGGGLTAIQAVQLLAKDVAHVTLCSRRPLNERHFDLPVDWFDKRTATKCMADFYHESVQERCYILKDARDGGSVPPVYLREIRRLELQGTLRCLVGTAEYVSTYSTSIPTVKINDTIDEYDAIVLACGSEPDCRNNALCQKLLQRWPLQVVGGLPCVSEDLEWISQLFVVGGLGSLNIGPDAGNLMGIRRAAQIVANRLDCRCWLHDSVLSNPFDALLITDSSDSETE